MALVTLSGWRSLHADYMGLECVLSLNATDFELGNAVLIALSKSRIVHPESDPELFDNIKGAERNDAWVDKLMDGHGYRTRSAMFKGMRYVRVEVQSDQMTVMPSKRERGEGFGPTLRREKDHVHLPANSSPEELGAAIRLGLERCIG